MYHTRHLPQIAWFARPRNRPEESRSVIRTIRHRDVNGPRRHGCRQRRIRQKARPRRLCRIVAVGWSTRRRSLLSMGLFPSARQSTQSAGELRVDGQSPRGDALARLSCPHRNPHTPTHYTTRISPFSCTARAESAHFTVPRVAAGRVARLHVLQVDAMPPAFGSAQQPGRRVTRFRFGQEVTQSPGKYRDGTAATVLEHEQVGRSRCARRRFALLGGQKRSQFLVIPRANRSRPSSPSSAGTEPATRPSRLHRDRLRLGK